jgi:hypothetical protein
MKENKMKTSDTYYVLRNKKDTSQFFGDFDRDADGMLCLTSCGVEEAWTEHNPARLIFKLMEYSDAFRGEWELAKVEQTTTITYSVIDAKTEIAKHNAESDAIHKRLEEEDKKRKANAKKAKKAKKAVTF